MDGRSMDLSKVVGPAALVLLYSNPLAANTSPYNGFLVVGSNCGKPALTSKTVPPPKPATPDMDKQERARAAKASGANANESPYKLPKNPYKLK